MHQHRAVVVNRTLRTRLFDNMRAARLRRASIAATTTSAALKRAPYKTLHG